MKLANFTREYADTLAGGAAVVVDSAVSSHAAGTASVHVASAVTIVDSGGYFTSGTVEGALQELGSASSTTELLIYDESSLQGTATALDFLGSGVSAAMSGGTAQVTITVGTASTNIPIYDEGSLMGTATSGLNFTGSGVSGTVTSGTAVITITSGTATAGTYPLDEYSIDGTYGDHFIGTALDAAWTRRNYVAGDETYQVGINDTYLRITPDGQTGGDGY